MPAPVDIDSALGLLLKLRWKYPQVTLGWDRINDRPMASPASLLRAHPQVVEELTAAKTRISPLLKWEASRGCCVYVSPRAQELLDWLYHRATPGFWPETFQLYPWREITGQGVVLIDTLKLEASQGPAYPAWSRVLQDLERLTLLEREGQL